MSIQSADDRADLAEPAAWPPAVDADAVSQAPTLARALEVVLEVACRSAGWPVGHALLPKADGGLRPGVAWHLDDPDRFAIFRSVTDGIEFVPGAGLPGRAAAGGRAQFIPDLATDASFLRSRAAAMTGLRSAYVAPVIHGDEVVAVIELFSTAQKPPSGDAVRLLDELSERLGHVIERERSADALRRSEARRRVIFDDSPFGMASFDADLRLLSVNAALCTMIGYQREELVGRALEDLVHQEDADRVAQLLRHLLSGHLASVHLEFRCLGAGGRVVTAHTTAWSEGGAGGARTSGLLAIEDNTARRTAQAHAVARERRLEAIAQQLGEVRDEYRLLQMAADAARDLLGTRYAAIGLLAAGARTFNAFVHSGVDASTARRTGDPPSGRGLLGALIAEDRPLRSASIADHPASAGFPSGHPEMSSFLGVPLPTPAGVIGYQFVSEKRDGGDFDEADEELLVRLAARVADAVVRIRSDQREQALRTQVQRMVEANLRLLREVRPDSLLQTVVDLARTVSDAEYAALGTMAAEDGEGFERFLHAGVAPGTAAAIGRMPTGVGVLRTVSVNRRPVRLADLRRHPAHRSFPDGHPQMTSFLGVPLITGGRVTGTLFVANKRSASEFNDQDEAFLVTLAAQAATAAETLPMHVARADLVERLTSTAERLRAETEAKWAFLGGLSHELRGSLSGILMSAELLRDPDLGVAEGQGNNLAANIHTVTQHVLGIVDNLLDLSRMEAKRLEVSLQPVPLRMVLDEVRTIIDPLAVEAGVAMDVPVVEREVLVLADPLRFRQVLINLLHNAVKFTDAGGHAWIDVRTSEHEVRIGVCDSGRGIDPKDAERIFEPFERGSAVVGPGAGLGLAIARGIIELHHGRIELSSSPGVGSQFLVTLRRARPEPDRPDFETEPELAMVPIAARPAAVLVVEDEAGTRDAAVRTLERGGYQVRTSATVEGAIEAVQNWAPDLVLLDVQLQDGDGLQAVDALRSLTGRPDLPIVAFTADRLRDTADRALAAGCNAYVLKPLSARALLSRVRGLLEEVPTGPATPTP
jgi:PAS domain S-box-containing protein